MKKFVLAAAVIASTLSLSAQAQTYTYQCTTDTDKTIDLQYSYSSNYRLERLDIGGQSFLNQSYLSVTRSGIMISVRNFRDGQDLEMSIMGMNGNSYALGSGERRRMKSCVDLTPRASRNDGI